MPFGEIVNQIPAPVFLVIHLTAFLAAVFFAWRSFGMGATVLAWGFGLYALAEISYMTYHLNWTIFLFAHTVSEVLDLAAFALVFAATTQRALVAARVGSR